MDSLVATARRQSLGDLLRRSALRRPESTALVFGERTWTYGELDREVDRLANAFASRGVGAGDRVALLSHNSDSFVLVYFALARIAAISVPINFMLTAADVAFILDHAGATGMVVEPALVSVADAAMSQLDHPLAVTVVLGDAVPGWEAFEDLMQHPDRARPEAPAGTEDPVQIMYTSGTEARPKGVTLSTSALVAQYVSCIVDGQMAPDDVQVHALPLYHCAQLHCFFTPGIYLGATNVVLPSADAGTILATIERHAATTLFAPPTVWISLLRHPDFESRDLSSLRKGYYGASIMPVEVLKEIGTRFPGMRLYNFYGQTEMGPVATVLAPEDQIRKAGSAGRAAINVETRVVDDDDQPLGPGQIGEIVHRSPHAMLGYWRDEERTAQTFRGGWLHSGDLGVLDDEGYLTVVDRKKDMIKTGGENVASREVEETIYQHPAVSEVAVFGLPDPLWIEAVTAAVVVRPGQQVDPAALIEFCRDRLPGFKTPKRVVLVDALPRNASGKVMKRELRATLVDDPSNP